jgi:hypothetical protein
MKLKIDKPKQPRECANPQNQTTRSEKLTNPDNLQSVQTHETKQCKAKKLMKFPNNLDFGKCMNYVNFVDSVECVNPCN